MTSSQHGPHALGHTHATMAGTAGGAKPRGGANPCKAGPSADRGLQLAPVKSELLVTAGQHTAVNTFSGLVHTARHVTKAGGA